MKKFILSLILLLMLSFLIVYYVYQSKKEVLLPVIDFNECVERYKIIQESYPEKCLTPDGQSFTREVGNELEKRDLIIISNPRPNQKIKSLLQISGEARGFWFFEASFPIRLIDSTGKTLGTAIATANPPAGGDWMTEDFVPFVARLEFDDRVAGSGTLVLEKDNPSGLPEHDDSLLVPVSWFGEGF